jgi:hypothetical protein
VRPTVRLETPGTSASTVGRELLALDTDMRTAATLWRREHRDQDVYDSVSPLEPVPNRLGELRIEALETGSFYAVLQAVGLVGGMLVDAPQLYLLARDWAVRLPFRIVRTERGAVEELEGVRRLPRKPRTRSGQIEDTDNWTREVAVLEARRLRRRITVESGETVLTVEEFV